MKKNIATTVELRQKNRRELLSLLINQGETTRNSLRSLSGFSYTTIGNLLNDLDSEDFVIQKGVAQSTGGRQAMVTKINPNKAFFISIDISTKVFRWGLYNLEGERVENNTLTTDPEVSFRDNFISVMEELNKICQEKNIKDRVKNIGVVITGYYSEEYDLITDSYDEERMSSLNIKESVSIYFQSPVIIKNDAKTAAYNEIKNLKDPLNSQLYYLLILKEGLGSAFLLNGKVFQGSNGYAGEIYPIKQVYNGEEATLGELLNPEKDIKELSAKLNRNINDDDFFNLLLNEDPKALDIYNKNVKAISEGLIPILCLLNPSDIRIAGFYNSYGRKLIKDIKVELTKKCESWQYENLNLGLSELSTYTLTDSLASQQIGVWVDSLWIS